MCNSAAPTKDQGSVVAGGLSPNIGKSNEEKTFAAIYKMNGNLTEAYRQAFREQLNEEGIDENDTQKIHDRAKSLIAQERMQELLAWHDKPAKEKAVDMLTDRMALGSTKDSTAAAKEILAKSLISSEEDAHRRWLKRMVEAGVEVVVPMRDGSERRISSRSAVKPEVLE